MQPDPHVERVLSAEKKDYDMIRVSVVFPRMHSAPRPSVEATSIGAILVFGNSLPQELELESNTRHMRSILISIAPNSQLEMMEMEGSLPESSYRASKFRPCWSLRYR
jgi:hypothetical protein